MYSKAYYDGMEKEEQENIINLVRCAWAGSQKYGALVWSGDIKSSFESLRNQFVAGLNMGLSGIPWWTTDIGGFFGADIRDEKFHELLIRWFQYGAFCPVMRLHGYRWPFQPKQGTTGGADCFSGADNEVWSYSDEVYDICKTYLELREKMKPYITKIMESAHKDGTPPMRTLFYDFPDDEKCWDVEDQYMFGPDILVAPILYSGMRERKVYLPKGTTWKNAYDDIVYEGGQEITADAPIDIIPLFLKKSSNVKIQFKA